MQSADTEKIKSELKMCTTLTWDDIIVPKFLFTNMHVHLLTSICPAGQRSCALTSLRHDLHITFGASGECIMGKAWMNYNTWVILSNTQTRLF